MILVLVILPLALIAAAALAARTSVRNSRLQITSGGVEIHNHHQPPRVVPLAVVERFEAAQPVGAFAIVQPRTGVLALRDGTRLAVRSLHDTASGAFGINALNERLEQLR